MAKSGRGLCFADRTQFAGLLRDREEWRQSMALGWLLLGLRLRPRTSPNFRVSVSEIGLCHSKALAPRMPEGGPGTRTFPLVRAQDDARANERLQPEEEGRERTFCNFASCNTAIDLGAPVGTDALLTKASDGTVRVSLANEMFAKFPNSDLFTEVGPADAQTIANEGDIVFGVIRARGHGHVVTVRPDNIYSEHFTGRTGSGPIVNDIGRYVRVVRASESLGSRARYFTPTDPTPRKSAPAEKFRRQ